MSAANSEEALRAKNLGFDWLQKGEKEKALKYFRISYRLVATSEMKLLIQKIELNQGDDESSHSKQKSDESDDNETQHNEKRPKQQTTTFQENSGDAVIRVLKSKSLYERLGVSNSSSTSEIRKSYRKLALQLHPDKNNHPKADEAFKSIAEAFEILSDPDKKKKYDLYGKTKTNQGIRTTPRFTYAHDIDDETLQQFQSFFYHHANRSQFPRQTRRTPQQPSTPFQSLLFFLFNLLFLAVVFLPVLTPYFEEKPLYSFRRNTFYSQERETTKMQTKYYVASNFDDELIRTRTLLLTVENHVEDEYLAQMQAQCSKERQLKQYYESKSRSFFMIAEEREKFKAAARDMETPGCDYVTRSREMRQLYQGA
jgi:curved DNA-binding protein CbpA